MASYYTKTERGERICVDTFDSENFFPLLWEPKKLINHEFNVPKSFFNFSLKGIKTFLQKAKTTLSVHEILFAK